MTIGAIATHPRIDPDLCGAPTRVEPGLAEVRLVTTANMAVDDAGLCHGGFVFGLADYAAMLAVNDPNVVLGAAQVKFMRPVRVGGFPSALAVGEHASLWTADARRGVVTRVSR